MALSRSMSSAVAGLKAHQTAMDVVGNNISNVNTYGFKPSTTMFRDIMYQTLSAGKAGVAGTEGGTNPSQVGYGAAASAVEVNISGQTGMVATNNPTDCFINGEGYFVVKNGSGYLYTRVGDDLKLDHNGYLTDGAGNYICGINEGSSATEPEPIHYTGADPISSISIGEDGSITANQNGTPVTIGQLRLAYFINPAGLTAVGNSYYSADSGNTGTATYEKPGGSATGQLVTGALEASGTDLANEFTNMIQFERGFQANTKIVTVNDEMLQTLVNMKN